MYKLGALFFLGCLAVNFALPPCVCPKHLKPVCGSDGHTYSNDCLLRCAQSSDPGLVMERRGRCIGNSLARARSVRQAEELCFCTFEYMPICGTDGNTYSNRCSLNCAARSAPVDVAHSGECRSKRDTVKVADLPVKVAELPVNVAEVPSKCTCPRYFAAVCGSNGITYHNQCVLECDSQNVPDLRLVHVGRCGEKPCTCSREMKPVCGTDGITYDNACVLNCAKDLQTDLEVQHQGECSTGVQVVDPATCTCTREGRPVCGTDGNTYANPCLLKCANEHDTAIQFDYEGPCDNRVKVVEQAEINPCVCTRNFRPVCASNGVTFSNNCVMKCAGTHLTVAREGPCEE